MMHEPNHDSQIKLKFCIEPDEDRYPPFRVESVWASPLPDGTFQLDNIPFFAYDAADGDVVTAKVVDGELFFDSVVQASGNSVVRVIVNDEGSIAELRAQLLALGCDSEWWQNMVSVNIPAEISYTPVLRLLEEGQESDKWGFEEAVLRHGDDA
jgi:hypothetical protein